MSTIKAANEAASRQPKRAPKSQQERAICDTYWSTTSTDSKICFHTWNPSSNFSEYSTEIHNNSVSTWKSKYVEELSCKQDAGEFEANGEIIVHSILQKKRGRSLLLVNELDDQVKRYIKEVRVAGTPIDTTVVMASGEAIVRRTDS